MTDFRNQADIPPLPAELADRAIRQFASGATRDVDNGKLAYEGFLAPLVLHRFAVYMHKHRLQADGSLRDPDNWQRGMPRRTYNESLVRHLFEYWLAARGHAQAPRTPRDPQDEEELLCAILFNTMGALNERLLERDL